MHTYQSSKNRRNYSAVESKRECSFTSLKKVLLCVVLLITLLLAPAAAVPTAETEESESLWKCKSLTSHLCNYATLNLPPNETLLVPGSGRDLKLRASQKKQAAVFIESSGEISTTGDVFFANSPVVTGLHLPEGATGNVHLQTTLETSRPEFCHVYNVFELSLDNYPTGSETVVRYTLPLSEIEEKGYNPIDITLCIYDNNIWQKLYTIYSMDSQNAYFEYVTTSLGTFAIVSDGQYQESSSASLGIGMETISPMTLNIVPTPFVTHPISYTAMV